MDLEGTLGPWLGRTMKMMDYQFQETFRHSNIDITKQQWIVLKILNDEDGKPQNNLAFITNRDKTSLTRLLSVMEKKNLVARIPSKSDKRINEIYLTTKGKNTFELTKPFITEILEILQFGLSEEEIQRTIDVMKKIQFNLTNNPIVATTTK